MLGAAEMIQASPEHEPAWKILERCASHISVALHDANSPWPEERLTYDNARIPEALLAADACTGDNFLLDTGLRLLEWLVAAETRSGHFSFTPVGGWAPGERRPGFDQQPVEAAAMADACSRAFSLTADERWKDLVERAACWFVGDTTGQRSSTTRKRGDVGTASRPREPTRTREPSRRWQPSRLSNKHRSSAEYGD